MGMYTRSAACGGGASLQCTTRVSHRCARLTRRWRSLLRAELCRESTCITVAEDIGAACHTRAWCGRLAASSSDLA